MFGLLGELWQWEVEASKIKTQRISENPISVPLARLRRLRMPGYDKKTTNKKPSEKSTTSVHVLWLLHQPVTLLLESAGPWRDQTESIDFSKSPVSQVATCYRCDWNCWNHVDIRLWRQRVDLCHCLAVGWEKISRQKITCIKWIKIA